jgi:hypothetical protein
MAASCEHDEPYAPQLTAISGVGQFYLGVSLVNYTSALIGKRVLDDFQSSKGAGDLKEMRSDTQEGTLLFNLF